MMQTHLQYAMGIAAENFDPSTDGTTLEVTPIEALHYVDGELKSNPSSDTVKGADASGAAQQTQVTTDNSVTATWFPWGSNRSTPPDIRRGERVILWRYSDRDKYLWTQTGLDDHLRKLETVTYVFNATQDESQTKNSADNSYYLEVSTHTGTATFQTSQANGEFTAHTLQFNPKEGKFLIKDGHGQSVLIDSTKNFIQLINGDDSRVTMDGQQVTIETQDSITLSAVNLIALKTKRLTIQAETLQADVSDSVTINTDSFTAKGNTFTGNFPTATLAGVTITNGKISCAGLDSSAPISAPNID